MSRSPGLPDESFGATPRATILADSSVFTCDSTSTSVHLKQPSITVYKPAQHSLSLLFSSLSRRDVFCLLIPAIIASLVSGGIAPFMTVVVGQSFNAFAAFPLFNPTQEDKNKLLHDVGISALELLALAIGSLVMGSITSSLWISVAECNVLALRRRIYQTVTQKDMLWFDHKMGFDQSVQSVEGDGPVGAGGMMAQFSKDTDDVRMASSIALGLTIQCFTTSLTALGLGFRSSWSLTLVVLATFPVLVLLGGLSEGLSQPLIMADRSLSGVAATLVDRAVASIATVKAFDAVHHERDSLRKVMQRMKSVAGRLTTIWGLNLGLTQFFMMAMFVQAFWYGSKLVRDGTNTPGQVMSVFWACLIATSNIHMAAQQLVAIAKGKSAMASIVDFMEAPIVDQLSYEPQSPHLYRKVANLKKIVPMKCKGALELVDISFVYPSRPTVPVLNSVSMFFSQGDMTFVVGGSGSGKSTIAQLLVRMYTPKFGQITLDQQDMTVLDEDYTRRHIALVTQTCIMFDMSVHDNVAMGLAGSPSGRRPEDVTRQEVIEACRMALMHDFVRDLPDGYDTMLGNGGANLSGGQKQRLAIARAYLRNPTVLILDEATSALDATSRLLVFEAIKQWRRNQTTIIITHDLTQISADDFVIVMKDGINIEAGYCDDLEQMPDGFFTQMLKSQGAMSLPEYDIYRELAEKDRQVQAILDAQIAEKRASMEPSAIGPSLQPLTRGNWISDVVSDIKRVMPSRPQTMVLPPRPSQFISQDAVKSHWRSSMSVSTTSTISGLRPISLQFSPISSVSTTGSMWSDYVVDDFDFELEKAALERNGVHAADRRQRHQRTRRDQTKLKTIKIEDGHVAVSQSSSESSLTFWPLMREIYPTVPHKFLTLIGLIVATASGAITPVFSFILSHLFVQVSAVPQNVPLINKFGGIVLALAAADGILLGLKYFILEKVAMTWVTLLRDKCYKLVLLQDKKWFDKVDGENGPARMVQVLIKDGDDARSLIATVFPQSIVVIAMFGTGMIWAMVKGWQLTLIGMAIAPVFVVTMTIQTNLVAKCELRNKRTREDVAKQYYEAISNVRSIRGMAFGGFFEHLFDKAAEKAYSTGLRGAFIEGCTYGVSSSLIYLSEAVLFYAGAIFIVRGTYTYLQMVEVLNLIVFTVSLGSQLMSFTERIAKSVQATRDLHRLLQLDTDTEESRGASCPPIKETLAFEDVCFTYLERPEAQILKHLSLKIAEGECVAIVGASGSGKSTLAALLLRLYQPTSGSLTIGSHDVASIDVNYLRKHVAVVTQTANLFDTSITENISYGTKDMPFEDVQSAAIAAEVHDFIMSLPKGYDTMVGENASLISGGQAQRIQIARALARPSKILVLDECTSALDPANQAAIMDTIREARIGRTTLMITHKLPVMKMCDRIVVVSDGRIAEEGTYHELMDRKGVFAQLASGGEWAGL